MFELNGVQLTLEDLQNHANSNNINFETYMSNMRSKGMIESAPTIASTTTTPQFGENAPGFQLQRQEKINTLQEETERKIRDSINKNTESFWAEENITPELREALEGTDWKIEEAKAGVNAITLTSEGGVEKEFLLQQSKYELGRQNEKPIADQIIDFINENPVKSKKYLLDKENFMNSMNNYYTKDKIKELTSKEFLANVKDEDDFKEKIKEDLGYGGWLPWDVDNRTKFLNLTDNDIDHIITQKFQLELGKEKTKRKEKLDADFITRLKSGEYIDQVTGEKLKTEKDFFNQYTKNRIAEFGKDEAVLATINMRLKHGELNADERKKLNQKRKDAIKVLKSKGEFESFWEIDDDGNYTGNLIKKPKTREDVYKNVESAESDINKKIAEIERENEGVDKVTFLDNAENKYYRNAKQISELRAQLNKRQDFEVGAIDPLVGYKRHVVNKSISEVLNAMDSESGVGIVSQDTYNPIPVNAKGEKTMSLEEYNDYRQRTRDQLKSLQIEQEALKRMYLLNESATSIEKKTPEIGGVKLGLFGQQSGKMALNSVFGEGSWENLTGKTGTETEIIDEYTNVLNDAGIPVSAEIQNYAERSFGQQVTEGVSGATGILLEFAVANKAFAIARAAKLLKGGKTFNDLIQGAKATRYTNKSGLILTEAQIAAKVAKAKKYKTVSSWVNRYAGKGKSFTAIGPHRGKWLGAALTEGVIEGVKFGILPSSAEDRWGGFATGFGFGLAGQFLTPVLGTVRPAMLEKVTPRNKIGNWVVDQAPRLDKAYGLAFKSPLSFAVGSELGEISLAVANDAWGLDEVSTFMDEHYNDYSSSAQRFFVNMCVGSGFGLAHKATYTNWKSLKGLRDAKAEAESKMYEKRDTYLVRKKDGAKGKEIVVTPEQWYKMDPKGFDIIQKPGEWAIKEGITVEEFHRHKDMADAMEYQIRKSEDALDLYDPVLAPFRLEKIYRNQNKHYKDKGATIEVIREDNNSEYFKKNPNAKAKVEYIDSNGKVHENFKEGVTTKVRQTFNVDKIEPGVAPHELGHSGTSILFSTNARFKADFLTKMGNIAKEVKIEGNRTLYDAMVEMNGKWDPLNRSWENSRISEWEMFSYVAEVLAKPENLRQLQASKAFEKFDKLIENNIGKELNQKYDFKTHKDIVQFFSDYIKTINKGGSSLGLLKHLENVIDKSKTGETEALRKAWEKEGLNFDTELQSRDLSIEKANLVNRNIELGKTKPEGWRAEMDINIKEILELNKNIEASEINAEQIAKYKEAIKEEAAMKDKPEKFVNPKKEKAVKELRENNEGILNEFVNSNYKETPGSTLTKSEFKNYVRNNEFLKILNSYSVESGVPFGAYLKQNLSFRMGNILKALGVDVGKQIKTISRDSESFTEKEYAERSSEPFSDEVAGGRKGIELIYELPVRQEIIDAINNNVPDVIRRYQNGEIINYKTLLDLNPKATKEMFGNKTQDKANFIANHWKTIDALLPRNLTKTTGTATGVENALMTRKTPDGKMKNVYYADSGKTVKFKDTGAKTGTGLKERINTKNKEKFLAELGIKDNRSKEDIDNNTGNVDISGMKTSVDRNITVSVLPAVINQTGKAINNQVTGRGVLDSGVKGAETMFNSITSGKGQALQSRTLERQLFRDQVNMLREVQSKEFKDLLKRNLKTIDDQGKAVGKTLVDYFNDYKSKNKIFQISDANLRTIGKELGKEFKFTKISPKKIASKTAKAIELPNTLRNIDIKAGLEPIPFTLNTLSDVVEARAATRIVTKSLVEKYGDGIYEAMLMRGESGGKGVGTYSNIGEMVVGFGKEGNRFSLHEGSEAAIDYMSDIINSKGKKYTGPGKTLVTGQGNKAGQLNRLINKKTGEWDIKALKEAYEVGEFNKKILKDAVNTLRKAYQKGDITHAQARQWVEIHGGPMTGLIKLAGSFAVVPNMSVKQMFKKYGKNPTDYVLEHTTPAQYIKARIYDYIINGGSAKKAAMDLTLKDYHTTLIPEKFDAMVNKTLQTDLPSWHLPGMDPISSRYYEANHPSDFGFGLRNFKTGKVYDQNPNLTDIQKQRIGKQLGEINNKLFPDVFKKVTSKALNSKQLEIANNIDKALSAGRKKNKKRKGGTWWDLDDTLARTKSGVRYTLPNPEGIPQPGRKVIFMAGGPGSGKSTVIKGLGLEKQGFKIVNQDISLQWLAKNHGLPTSMKDFTPAQASKWGELSWDARMIAKRKQTKFQGKGDGIIVDGTGNSLKVMQNQVREFKNKGYDVQMVFVETSLGTALQRNRIRKERSLKDNIVTRTHESVQNNKEAFRELFGDNFAEIKTDNLKQKDPMPTKVVNKLDNFTKGYIKGRLDAGEYAQKGAELEMQGAKFDFKEFDYIKEGTEGPLWNKAMDRANKFGTKDTYILTARPHAAQMSIFRFLQARGLKIPFENIITLENSTPEAKALEIAKKIGEGYNDFYFADDALQNVQAVKNMMNQFDVKGKVQQALQSRDLNVDINNMMEHSLGVESGKRFSKAEGKVRGKDIKRRRIIMPDSAADMELLIEPLLGRGKEGMENRKWFEKNLYKPWEKGVNDLNTARQTILNDYMSLRKQNKDVVKLLDKEVEGTNFTNDQAMRVYLWNKAGFKIPDLTKTSEAKLVEYVKNRPELQAYAEKVATLTKIETGLKKPRSEWWAETLASEVSETGRTIDRKKYIADWIERKNEIFSEVNLNKMESRLGTRWRSDIEDMFDRMETGRTRGRDMGRIGNKVMNYLNGSVGAIMNLNTRSATLQLISSVNFINHAENNPLAATRAFANQPQYWKDFMTIMNSNMLKQRRAGLQINVTEAELAAAAEGGGNKAKRALAWILKQGYIPTKIADSFAIASGGATYYRNRIRMYEKQGLKTKEAEKKAWIDFQSIAEKTQQSSRADLLSRQQTSFEGRLILPFANTPLQMNRIMLKEILDISKGRYEGWFGENSFTNKMSKIGYYGAIQSLIFAGLQSGLFALMANSKGEEDEKLIAEKKVRTVNTMTDSFLRGMGIQGAVVAGLKNAILKFLEQNEKGYRADYTEVGEALLNISPTIGSKISKLDGAGNTYNYNKKEILEKGLSLDNTKAIEASAQVVEAITNVPVHRVVRKTQNIQGALDKQNEDWQRLMMLLGWSRWDVGIFDKKKEKKKKDSGPVFKKRGRKKKGFKLTNQ